MNIIITMAGESKRFKQSGVAKPKHLIEAKGKSLFEWAMLSLKYFYDQHFIFITRKDNHDRSFILEKCQSLEIKTPSIQEIDFLTKGQAETALKAENKITNPDDEIVVYNIDTYVEPDQIKPQHIKGDGWIPAFKAQGDRWSFVKIAPNRQVLDIAEKVKISNYGTIGLYYFKSFGLYKRLYSNFHFENTKERYIAPLYRPMLDDPKMTVFSLQ